MNKIFHQLVPILALNQMPESFQKFMITNTHTIEDIKYQADLPDLVDKDNIELDAFCKHAHSYKMDMVDNKLQWIAGDALERVKALSIDAFDYFQEKDFNQTKYCLSKQTHYLCDSRTFPHEHVGKPWSEYHVKFEHDMGNFIQKHQNNIGILKFEPYKDVYNDCDKEAKELWVIGNEVVNDYINGKKLNEEIAMDVVKRCIIGIGSVWTTIAEELKIL